MEDAHNPDVITPKPKWRGVKPYKSFPLTPYPRGWGKKIDGAFRHVCGQVSADEALKVWYERAEELTGGKKAEAQRRKRRRRRAGGYTVGELIALYRESRAADVDAGEIGAKMYTSIRLYLRKFARAVGGDTKADDLDVEHFDKFAAAIRGLAHLSRKQAKHFVSAMLVTAEEQGWINRPPRLGKRFRRLGRKTTAETGSIGEEGDAPAEETDRRVLTATECRLLLRHAYDRALATERSGFQSAPAWRLYAALLLALNGGYGPKELAQIRRARVHLDSHPPMIRQKRGKTGVLHRVPLWPETVTALFRVYADAPVGDRVFVGRTGRPLVHERTRGKGVGIRGVSRTDSLSKPFRRALRAIGVTGLPKGEGGMYMLRHTHRSVSGGAKDEAAADVVIGHALPGMRKTYQQVGVERLVGVSDHVRGWLNPQRVCLPPAPDLGPAYLKGEGVAAVDLPRRNAGRRKRSASGSPPGGHGASSV